MIVDGESASAEIPRGGWVGHRWMAELTCSAEPEPPCSWIVRGGPRGDTASRQLAGAFFESWESRRLLPNHETLERCDNTMSVPTSQVNSGILSF